LRPPTPCAVPIFTAMTAPFNYVMLIDDDEDDREIFLTVIKENASSVVCNVAENGREALDKLTQEFIKPDLIFLDLNMPRMNGREFLTEIKKFDSLRDIPVIILSTSADKETISETRKLGAQHFISKPDKFSTWETLLKQALQNFVES
jgi:CheY-like chemotaxis protein